MKTSFKMLVATDYSDVAINAERYAIELAKGTNSIITFLYVFEKSESFPREFTQFEHVDYTPMDYEMQRLEQHVEKLLQAMKIKAGEVEYKCIVSKGEVIEEMNNEVKDIDFIVIGTHGASNLKQIFLGSHTWKAIKKINIPLLAIPAKAAYSPVQSIVYATDYKKSELPVIRFLAYLAMQFNAELTVLHVANDLFSAEFEKEMFNKFIIEVKAEVNYEKLNLRLIHDAELVAGIDNFCIRNKSNWLVMSPQKESLFEKVFMPLPSTTKQMSFYTHVPLFSIPNSSKLKNQD